MFNGNQKNLKSVGLTAVSLALVGAAWLLLPIEHSPQPHPSAETTQARLQPTANPAAAEPTVSFNRDIRPILSDKCFACHGFDSNTREAGLRLDERAEALKPHDTGTPIVPGDPDNSTLIDRITTDNVRKVMPPRSMHKSVSKEEIALLRQWIKEGAAYEPHWAFIKPTMPELPGVNNGKWVRNPIDRFRHGRARKDRSQTLARSGTSAP